MPSLGMTSPTVNLHDSSFINELEGVEGEFPAPVEEARNALGTKWQ